ncbi:glycosyltransferase family 2 protein [Methylobacter sp. sgz302048]|uniref:glycosyltransferase family 2 protein n=1 Tax=Methylobacter sp. sgz302048 TaxID=3455945 RepID=UPI003FA0C568
MDLSIIIVNWNSKDYLQKCIASVFAWTSNIDFEIVVIDSASYDGADEMLKRCYPQVRFIQSDLNLGFAKANNVAFRESTGRYVLFLNPDTELIGPAINILFDAVQMLPKAGAVGCKLLNADRSVQTSCIQAFPTILNQMLSSEYLRFLFPRSSLWGMNSLFGAKNEPAKVDMISGACLMLRRSVFEQAGLFSEDYFMYAEDLELCYKIRQIGYSNYYIPTASVIHFGGGSTEKGPSEFSVVMARESLWRYMKKNRGNIYGSAYRASIAVSAIGRLLVLVILLPLHCLRQSEPSWNSSLKKWWTILAWSLGLKTAVSNQS